MATFNSHSIDIHTSIYTFLFVSSLVLTILHGAFIVDCNLCSVLPESTRWMISKGHYSQAERLFRKIAKTNGRTFDQDAFEKLKNEQEKVRFLLNSTLLN
jgi:hypothetical protein